jgi:hypothetical protein
MTGPDPGAGYIVDASVALKWLIEEDGSEAALSLRDSPLMAPALPVEATRTPCPSPRRCTAIASSG